MLKSKKSKIAILLGVILFYVIFVLSNDVKQFSYEWTNVQISFIPLILGMHFLVLLLRTIRQKILFDNLGVKLSLKENMKIHMSGLSLITTPGGIGQTIKAYYLKSKYNFPYSKTISVTLAERYHDLVGIIPFIVIFLLFRESFYGWLIVGVISSILTFILLALRNEKITIMLLSKTPKIGLLKKNTRQL